MKVLHLNLRKKWYDMILSGEKKEEYREIKPYWVKRIANLMDSNPPAYDVVEFRNGYGKDAPRFRIEYKGVKTGDAIPEWSDNWCGKVFIISLGDIIK